MLEWTGQRLTFYAEVERAHENLIKSGKPFGPGFPPNAGGGRRESMPMMGGGPAPRAYPEYGALCHNPRSNNH